MNANCLIHDHFHVSWSRLAWMKKNINKLIYSLITSQVAYKLVLIENRFSLLSISSCDEKTENLKQFTMENVERLKNKLHRSDGAVEI